MADRHALFDRDVFLKLVACNLWAECLDALGITHPYRLASASVRSAKTPLDRWKPPITAALRNAIIKRIDALQGVVPIIPETWMAQANEHPLYNAMTAPEQKGIDEPDARLAIIALSSSTKLMLVSGDKRFLRALRSDFPQEFERLHPSIICFEDCLCAIVKRLGIEAIREQLYEAKSCDGTLRNAISSDGLATQKMFLEGMASDHPLRP